MNKIDEEMLSIARADLVTAFRQQFSSLVKSFEAAAKGLNDNGEVTEMMQEACICGPDPNAKADTFINIYVAKTNSSKSCGCETLLEAIDLCENDDYTHVVLDGKTLYKKFNGLLRVCEQ